VSIVASVIGQMFCLLMISIILAKRQCHTINNLFVCDLCASLTGYFILQLVQCIYGLRKDWFSHQPACTFRAYLIVVMLSASVDSFISATNISQRYQKRFKSDAAYINFIKYSYV
jgi:hypothetical protein